MTRLAIKKAREKYLQGNPKSIICVKAKSEKKNNRMTFVNGTDQDMIVIIQNENF